jgi:hypothetical protein
MVPKARSSIAARIQINGRAIRPEPGSRGIPTGGAADRRVVVTLSVAVAGPEALGVTVDGEIEQVASVGRPLHESATGELYPATELTETVSVAVFPATTVEDPADSATAKSEPPPVKGTNCGLFGAESLIVRAPAFEPKALGVKVTLMVQIALGATGAPQVFVSPKPELAEINPKVKGAVPVLVTVIICGELVEPTT